MAARVPSSGSVPSMAGTGASSGRRLRTGLLIVGLALAVIGCVALLLWRMAPRWWPRWTAEHAPSADMALLAIADPARRVRLVEAFVESIGIADRAALPLLTAIMGQALDDRGRRALADTRRADRPRRR